MNITITGASGFVGQNLKPYLQERSFNVNDLSLRGVWQLPDNTDIVIHLAGKAHDTSNTSSSNEYFKVNRDLTIHLFNAFLNSNAKDFFYFSSVKAAADTVSGVLTEDVSPKPITPYGQSKIEAEEYLLAQDLPENKRLFIIRPCMIHGPGNKGNLNLLYNVVEKGMPWPLASFENKRSFLSIDNLSYLVHQMITNKQLASGIYNFADDETLSTNELVTLISKTLDVRPKLWHIPSALIKFGVKIGDVVPLPLNSERLKKLTESYIVANQKIKAALGIDKLPLTAKQGLEITIKSFK